MKVVNYSCMPGVGAVAKKDQADLRTKLMEVFGAGSIGTYYNKVNCYRNIPWHIKQRVDEVFNSFGVPSESVWHTWEEEEESCE